MTTLLDILVQNKLLAAAKTEPAATSELVERVVDAEIGGREREIRRRSHRALDKQWKDAHRDVREAWVANAKRLVPRLVRAGMLQRIDGKLHAIEPRDEDEYGKFTIAAVFGVGSDQQRVYEAARALALVTPEFGARGVITYMRRTRKRNQRALTDDKIFEALMWFMTRKLFVMWFEKPGSGERVSAEDGIHALADNYNEAKEMVPMFAAVNVPIEERLALWRSHHA